MHTEKVLGKAADVRVKKADITDNWLLRSNTGKGKLMLKDELLYISEFYAANFRSHFLHNKSIRESSICQIISRYTYICKSQIKEKVIKTRRIMKLD